MIWKKYKELMTILAFLALIAIVYFFVIDRLVTEINDKKNRLYELTAIQENQRKRLNDLSQFEKDFEMLGETEKKIHPFLKKDKAVELIQEIEKLAESTGNNITIEVGSPDVPVKASAKNVAETISSNLPIKEYIQLRIKMTGSFFSLLKFLNKLENSNYYLDVVSLQISKNQNPEENKSEATAKNPFKQSFSTKSASQKADEENSEETISLINVAVYTQN